MQVEGRDGEVAGGAPGGGASGATRAPVCGGYAAATGILCGAASGRLAILIVKTPFL